MNSSLLRPLSFVLICFLANSICAQEVKLHGDCVLEFANRKQSETALTNRDVFVAAMSRFDRQSRMQAKGDPSTEEYFAFLKKHVAEWSAEQKEKATIAIKKLSEKMAGFKIPFPKKILLVTTDGKEEGGAAYCRGATIVLPQNMLRTMSTSRLEQLINHELFHVLSNQNPKLRKTMYSIIGFKPCGREIQLPKDLVNRKITNPDGPTVDYYVEIKDEDKKEQPVVPVLFAKSNYDADKGGSFFQYLQFKLMAIEKKGDRWDAVQKDGLPVYFEPGKTPSYFEKIGNNTSYIIHPDEVLADNFVYLIQKRKNLKTPHIVEKLRGVLTSKKQ